MPQAQIADILEGLLFEAAWALDNFDPAPSNPVEHRLPAAAPERQLVDHGQVTVWPTCPEQLAVFWMRVIPKPEVVNPRNKCAVITQVQFTIQLNRCAPKIADGGVIPSPADETEASLQLAADMQAIWKHLTTLLTKGGFPGGVTCDHVIMNNAEPTSPAGGSQGAKIILTVTL